MSNWGGYALSAGVAIAMARGYERVLPDDQQEMELVQRIVQGRVDMILCETLREFTNHDCLIVTAGARDGTTGHLDGKVDGMDLQVSLDVLKSLRNILTEAANG